jgi:hypothetical protein
MSNTIKVACFLNNSHFQVNLITGKVKPLDDIPEARCGDSVVEKCQFVVDLGASQWGGIWQGDDAPDFPGKAAVIVNEGQHYTIFESPRGADLGWSQVTSTTDSKFVELAKKRITDDKDCGWLFEYNLDSDTLTCQVANKTNN